MAFEVVFLTALVIAVPLVLAIDVVWLEHGVRENSVTEYAQEGLLFLSMVLVSVTAWRNPGSRGVLVLVAGLFATMLIREADAFLDAISQGFWVYPAGLVALSSIVYAFQNRGNIIDVMVDMYQRKSFAYLVVGMLLVVVFSRLFGTGQLWQIAMGDDYRNLYKSMIQEGLELLGYALIFFGSTRIYTQSRRDALVDQHQ